jgi:hypothetical protein
MKKHNYFLKKIKKKRRNQWSKNLVTLDCFTHLYITKKKIVLNTAFFFFYYWFFFLPIKLISVVEQTKKMFYLGTLKKLFFLCRKNFQ